MSGCHHDATVLRSPAAAGRLQPEPQPQPGETASAAQRLRSKSCVRKAKSCSRRSPASPTSRKFKDQIEITITKDGLRIELIEQSEGLFFDIGSARLKPDAVQLLRLIASRLGTFPNDVIIEGHTDSRPYARAGYNNWDLSTDRANSARRVIEEGGIRDQQIAGVNGYADRRLKNAAKPLDFSNRRVTILVAFASTAAPRATVCGPGRRTHPPAQNRGRPRLTPAVLSTAPD